MVDFVYVFLYKFDPSLFYDEGYLFWKMNVDKFENIGDKFTMLGDKLKKFAGSSQC